MDRLQRVVDFGYECGAIVDSASEYAEPGYSGDCILFGDWNRETRYDAETKTRVDRYPPSRDPRERVARVAERLGAKLEWCDEWATCGECGAAVRTQPDSYSWTRSFHIFNECELVCIDCCLGGVESYVDSLVGNLETADTFGVDLAALGFSLVEDGESGWHPGQDSDPAVMAAGVDGDLVFQIDGVGQFDCRFSLWRRTV